MRLHVTRRVYSGWMDGRCDAARVKTVVVHRSDQSFERSTLSHSIKHSHTRLGCSLHWPAFFILSFSTCLHTHTPSRQTNTPHTHHIIRTNKALLCCAERGNSLTKMKLVDPKYLSVFFCGAFFCRWTSGFTNSMPCRQTDRQT